MVASLCPGATRLQSWAPPFLVACLAAVTWFAPQRAAAQGDPDADPVVAPPARLEPAAGLPAGADDGGTPLDDRPLDEAVRVERAGDPCFEGRRLLAGIAGWLGTSRVPVGIEIVVQTDEELQFRVERRNEAPATRVFETLPAACDARVNAVSLAIALAIDHTVLDRSRAESGTDGDEGSSATEGQDAPDATGDGVGTDGGADSRGGADAGGTDGDGIDDGDRSGGGDGGGLDSAFAVGIFVAAELQMGVVPDGPGPGARAGFSLWLADYFDLELGAIGSLPNQASLGSGTVEYRLLAGTLDLCLATTASSLRYRGCIGAAAGQMAVEGRGYPTSMGAGQPWIATTAALGLAWPAEGVLSVGIDLRGVLPVYRSDVHIADVDGATLASRGLPPVGGQLSLVLSLLLR